MSEDKLLFIEPKTGEPVEPRITSVDAARALFEKCVLESEPLSMVRARIRRLVDGNPPYSEEELRRRNMGWRTNVNFREAESIIESNTAQLWELQQDLFVLARFQPKDPSVVYHPSQLGQDYASILSEEYTRVLRADPSFFSLLELVIRDSLRFGIGCLFWHDPYSWLPQWVPVSSILFPSMAKCDITKLDFFFVRDELDLGLLFSLFRAEGAEERARSMGWNVDWVKKVLIAVLYGGQSEVSSDGVLYPMSRWESLQMQIRNYDSEVQRRQYDSLRVVRLFVRSLEDSRVSQFMFTESPVFVEGPSGSAGGSSREEFLFQGRGEYESMSQCLWWLLYSYGDGYLRSVKGLGHRIAPHCELSNRFLGHIFDAGMFASTLMLQLRADTDAQRLNLLRVGPVTYLPSNVDAVNAAFSPRLDAMIMLRDMSSAILNNNVGVFRVKNENPLRRDPEKTAYQVRAEEAKEVRFEKNQIAYFYAQLDFLHREIARRLLRRDVASSSLPLPGREAARSFRERCLRRGVPESLLDASAWDVFAERAIGLGSQAMRMDITAQLLQIKGMLPEENQAQVVREYIAARVGAMHVDRFMPLKPKDMYSSDAASIATLENNDFMEGSFVPVGSDQLHAVHIPIHFVPLVQILEVIREAPERLDVRQAHGVFSTALPHIEQHLAFMALDHLPQDYEREKKLSEYTKVFKQLNEARTHLETMLRNLEIAERKKAEQQAQQMQELARAADERQFLLKKYEIDRQAELERYKADLLNQARQSKTEVAISLAVRRALADIAAKAKLTDAQVASILSKAAVSSDKEVANG